MVVWVHGGAGQVFRDYVQDGVSSSGLHRPVKAEVRALLGQLEALVGASGAGVASAATVADIPLVVDFHDFGLPSGWYRWSRDGSENCPPGSALGGAALLLPRADIAKTWLAVSAWGGSATPTVEAFFKSSNSQGPVELRAWSEWGQVVLGGPAQTIAGSKTFSSMLVAAGVQSNAPGAFDQLRANRTETGRQGKNVGVRFTAETGFVYFGLAGNKALAAGVSNNLEDFENRYWWMDLAGATPKMYLRSSGALSGLEVGNRTQNDARYAVATSLKAMKEDVRPAELQEEAFLLAVKEWIWGGQLLGDDPLRGRRGVGFLVEDAVALGWEDCIMRGPDGEPKTLQPLAILARYIDWNERRVGKLERLVYEMLGDGK